jgi:STE24 endopeptidase
MGFDAKAATDAYLATMSVADRARSDAYFTGGYWLMLFDFAFGAFIMWLLLSRGWSARMRELAERAPRSPSLRVLYTWLMFLGAVSVLDFVPTVYAGYFREHQYGLSNQTFGAWLADHGKGLAVSALFGGLLVTALFAVVRRLPKTWWLWGAVVSLFFVVFALVIGPVFIAPLFNHYTPLKDEKIKQSILSMARANGIPVTEVYEVDESLQSKRVSANVMGFGGTERVSLNDNLIKRCTLPEIQAVMGHEMGHYVLHHVYKMLLFFAVVIVIAFGYLRWALGWTLRRWGARWGVRGVDDPAVLPLVALLMSTFLFVLTPLLNTEIRTQEYEADMYGLNAARQPDANARVDLMLAEYRKMDPSPLEEWLFYDHPSGRNRIYAAMRWKAEHLPPADAADSR